MISLSEKLHQEWDEEGGELTGNAVPPADVPSPAAGPVYDLNGRRVARPMPWTRC